MSAVPDQESISYGDKGIEGPRANDNMRHSVKSAWT